MITKKTIRDLSQQIASIYGKGVEAAEKNNIEYAINLLKAVVIEEPGFSEAREKLRNLEKQITSSLTLLQIIFRSIKIRRLVKRAQLDLVRNRHKEALKSIEEAFVLNVKYLPALYVYADIMEAEEAPFAVIETYELAREFYPDNPHFLRKLADIYKSNEMGAKELKIRQKLSNMFPNDISMKSELRSASASAVLEKKELGQETSSFDMLKDKEETEILEQKERTVRSIDDVQKLIEKHEKDLEKDPNSLSTIRSLADLYQKANVHDKALEYFKKFEEINEICDITTDKAIEKSEIALIQTEINALSKKESEANNKKVTDLEQQIKDTKKTHALKRVELYPNDLTLRYSLGLIHWDEKEIDSAIEQFQMSQKNLKYQVSSHIYLGRCFIEKKQFDIAVEQLQRVVDKQPGMTDQKMEALYYLGISYETIDTEKAKDCFKQIYSVKANYQDVSERIQKYYK